MASYLPNYPYGGYGGGPHQYAYNLRDQTVQRVPSGVFFNLGQIDAGGEELKTLEEGIDPFYIFPNFHNLDGGYVSNSSDGASTSSTSSEARCLPLLDVNIDVDVQSSIAKTKVMQTFTNLSNYAIKEANYSFPLYDGSAVISFRCHVGEDKLLEGVIKPKEVAKMEFKEAVAKQKITALLEEHTPEVFETKLGNIPARTSVKVEITYVNELKADIGGEGVLVTLPTSIAPRYGAPPPQMSASSATDKNGLHLTVHVHALVSLRKLESRTHPISVEMGTAGTAGIPAAVSSFGDLAGAVEGPDNEFDQKKAKATLSERHVTLGRDFFLLILATGSSMLASGAQLEEAPGAEAQSAMKLTLNPRDLFSSYVEPESFNGEIIFIADRSESMRGPKMGTLRDALNVSLKSLTEKVRFNIYSFGSRFFPLWPQSQLYTDDNVELAVRNVSTFTANMGGTEILQPIKEAVRKRIIKNNFTTQIICLTDGEIWDEAAVRKFVRDTRSELKGAVRFFALGIGNVVSHRLIEGIGTEGGGFAEVVDVDSPGRWEGRVMRMLKGALMPESYDCELEFDGMSTKAACSSTEGSSFMQAPYKIPALHPFSRMTIYFLFDKKYGTDLSVVSLKTSTPSGEQISVKVLVSKTTASTYIVHHLAAKAIVMDLETGKSWLHSTISNSKAADTAAKEFGERLAINYHITSKWTSFVAIEKKRNEQNAGRLYKAPMGDLALLNKSRTAPISQLQQARGPVNMLRNTGLVHIMSHSAYRPPGARELATVPRHYPTPAAATTTAAGDLSWADAVEADANDDWGTFTTAGREEGKKRKAAYPTPKPALEPPTSKDTGGFDDINLGGSAPKIDMSFGDTSTSTSKFGFGGLSSWTSGWGFDGDFKDKSTDKDENPWDTGKKDKKKDAFDFNFDVFNEPPADPPPPVVGEEKKKKKGVVAAVEETPLPPPPSPEPEPEPGPVKEDDCGSAWGATTTKKDKKGKKGLVEEIREEPKVEEPPPPPPEPLARHGSRSTTTTWGERDTEHSILYSTPDLQGGVAGSLGSTTPYGSWYDPLHPAPPTLSPPWTAQLQTRGSDSTPVVRSPRNGVVTQIQTNSTPIPRTSNATKALPAEVQKAKSPSRWKRSLLQRPTRQGSEKRSWLSDSSIAISDHTSSSTMPASRPPPAGADGKLKSDLENTSSFMRAGRWKGKKKWETGVPKGEPSASSSDATHFPSAIFESEFSATRESASSIVPGLPGGKTEKYDESPQHAAAAGIGVPKGEPSASSSDATHFPGAIFESEFGATRESTSSMRPVNTSQTVTAPIVSIHDSVQATTPLRTKPYLLLGSMSPPQESTGTRQGIVEVRDEAKSGFEDTVQGRVSWRRSKALNQVWEDPGERDSPLKSAPNKPGPGPETPTFVLQCPATQGTSARRWDTIIDYDDDDMDYGNDNNTLCGSYEPSPAFLSSPFINSSDYSMRRVASLACDSLAVTLPPPPPPSSPPSRAPALSEPYSALPLTATIVPLASNAAVLPPMPRLSHTKSAAAALGPTSTWSDDGGGDNGSMALNLHNLIRVQSAKGSFKLPSYLLKALCSYFNVGILSTLDDTLSSSGEDMKTKLGDTIELLLQTLLAVMWIKLACAKDKEIWELVVRKAEKWVGKTIGDKRVEERLCECARAQWGSAGRG